jgi:hypothetical protein
MTQNSLLASVVALAVGFLAAQNVSAAEPVAKPSDKLDIQIAKTAPKYFGDSGTIIIPTVYLKLAVAGKVSATKQGGMFGGNNTAKAKAKYAVAGLDKQYVQQLAQKIQDDLVAQLKAAGFTVKTYADIKDLDAVKSAKREPGEKNWGMPTDKEIGGTALNIVAAPSDEQVFKQAMMWGVFNQFVSRTKSTLGEGSILIPTYVIAAPQVWAETSRGYKSISAGVNVADGMNMTHARADLLTAKCAGAAVATKTQVINVGEKVGTVTDKDTTDNVGNAISFALNELTGLGKISSSSGFYQMTIDPAAYEAGVMRGVTGFNAEVAKIAAEARK